MVQNPAAETSVPTDIQLIQWAEAALDTRCQQAEITIRIVDPTEGTGLNTHYRHKDGPTNVLSFSYTPPIGMEALLLGDIVICASVVAAEAKRNGQCALPIACARVGRNRHWKEMLCLPPIKRPSVAIFFLRRVCWACWVCWPVYRNGNHVQAATEKINQIYK